MTAANWFKQLTLPNSFLDRIMRSASVSSRGSRQGAGLTQSGGGLDRGVCGQDDGGSKGAYSELEYSQSSLGAESRGHTGKNLLLSFST